MISKHHINTALAAAFALGLTTTAALSAPPSVDRSSTSLQASKQVEPASVEVSEEDSVNCAKSRKRLWVEGEGWLVRKVTTCH